MKKKAVISTSAAVVLAAVCGANAQTSLTEVGVNIDGSGTTYDFLNPAVTPTAPGTDFSGFSISTGLGSITATVTGAGSHQYISFLDDEADLNGSGFINDLGATHGTAAGNQSWQIDEPGYGNHGYFGTIGANTFGSTVGHNLLDNVNHIPGAPGDDVALALGYDFSLTSGQTAKLKFLASNTAPSGGFYLEDIAPSGITVYLSSSLDISGGSTTTGVPDAASTLPILTLALAGLAGCKYKFARN